MNSFFALREFLFYLRRLDPHYKMIPNPQSRNIHVIHELCAMDVSSIGILEVKRTICIPGVLKSPEKSVDAGQLRVSFHVG